MQPPRPGSLGFRVNPQILNPHTQPFSKRCIKTGGGGVNPALWGLGAE